MFSLNLPPRGHHQKDKQCSCKANISKRNVESEMAMDLCFDEIDEEPESEAHSPFIYLVDAEVPSHLTFHVAVCDDRFEKLLFAHSTCALRNRSPSKVERDCTS